MSEPNPSAPAIARRAFDHGHFVSSDLREMGFRSVGENVRIEGSCTIIGAKNISFGDNVRIDGYCTIVATGEGHVRIGSYVHIAGYCGLYGGHGIVMEDFSGLSSGVRIYSASDDYSGEHLTNPTVPAEYLGGARGEVRLGKHAIVGANTVILPGAVIGEGSAVGSQALVTKSLDPWGIYAGSPAKRLKERSRALLALEAKLRGSASDQGD